MKLIVILCAGLLAACACKCRDNGYMPEGNRLVIPEDLRPVKN